MASSKQKGVIWLILAGVLGWTVYKLSGSNLTNMQNNIKASIMPDSAKK